ncbi:MAG TPA: hypothetical protein VF069_27235 [Streptosporangiaceae bacterium]
MDDPVHDDPVHEDMGTDEQVAAATEAQRRLTEALLREAGATSVDELVERATVHAAEGGTP